MHGTLIAAIASVELNSITAGFRVPVFPSQQLHIMRNDSAFDDLDPHDLVAKLDLAFGFFVRVSELSKSRCLDDPQTEVAQEFILGQTELLVNSLSLRLVSSEYGKGFQSPTLIESEHS